MEKIVKLMVQELGNTPKAKVSGPASNADYDDEWEDDYTGTSVSIGALRGALDVDSREVDSETYSIIVRWFKHISENNVGDFYGIYDRLTDDEKAILQVHAS